MLKVCSKCKNPYRSKLTVCTKTLCRFSTLFWKSRMVPSMRSSMTLFNRLIIMISFFKPSFSDVRIAVYSPDGLVVFQSFYKSPDVLSKGTILFSSRIDALVRIFLELLDDFLFVQVNLFFYSF
jgi:hypothetical protein